MQHTFSVVRSAGSEAYNYVNPPRRDVVNTGVAGDNVTIRFRVCLLFQAYLGRGVSLDKSGVDG